MIKRIYHMIFITTTITALIGITGVSPSYAESASATATEDQDSIPVFHLGEIMVVKGKKDTPKASVSEITSLHMKLAGTRTVKTALNSAPGVVTTTGTKGESRLQIRGFQGRETLILLDGRPINMPYYGQTDLNMIPISNISKIKVVKGPAAAVYGANTLGGLVNLVSKRIRGASLREVRLSVSANDTYDADINFGAARGNLDYWLSLGYAASDGWNLSDDFEPTDREDGGLRDTSSYRSYNIDGKLNYTLQNGTVLSFSTGYHNSERGLPVATEIDKPRYDRFPDWRRYYLDISSNGFLGDRLTWRGKLYYDVAKNRLIRYRDDTYSEDYVKFNSFHDSFDVGSRFAFTYKLSERIDNTFGLNLRIDGIDRQGNTGDDWLYSDAVSGSVFTQFLFNLSDQGSIDIGASYNRNEADAVNASTGSLDPYAGVRFTPDERLSVHLAASRATRFPTLSHLYAEVSGNPDLKPEQAIKFEIGYRITFENGFSLTQDYFRNDINDLIDRVSRDSLYMNIDEVLLEGVETGVRFSSDVGITASVSFTYLDAYDKDPVVRRSWTPRNKTDYSITYISELGFEISHTGQYVADRADTYEMTMRDYYLAHLKASYMVMPQLKLSVNIRNVFDRNYEEERYYPMPGRRVFFGLESRF